ncbi:hypothetical protein [Persephonella sp.]
MGREIIEEFESEKGIKATLEYDNEREVYIMTVYKDTGKIVFQGSMQEIQKQAERFFVSSLRDIKNKIEIALLEDMFNR